MGSLKPGATYVYEHVDGITYAREHGASTNTRFEIGRTFERQQKDQQIKDFSLWADIFEEAKSNKTLYDAVEMCKMLYYLSKDNGSKT